MRIISCLVVLMLCSSLHASQIIGPVPDAPPPQSNSDEIVVKQGNPPLVPLKLVDEEGNPVADKIVKWIGPIGEEEIATQCSDIGLIASSAVVGTFSFSAVIVPPQVNSPDDIEVVSFKLIVRSGTDTPPPPDNPDPPDQPDPPPVSTDLSEQASQWLAAVPAEAHVAKANVKKAIDEIVNADVKLGITEMELFLGVGLSFAYGDYAVQWSTFSVSANTALRAIKNSGATADEYRQALASIGRALV